MGPSWFPAGIQQRYSHRLRDGTGIGYVPLPSSSRRAALEDFKAKLVDHCSACQQPVERGTVVSNLIAGSHQQGSRHTLSEKTTLLFLQALVEDKLFMRRIDDKAEYPHTCFAQVGCETLKARAITAGYSSITMNEKHAHIETTPSSNADYCTREAEQYLLSSHYDRWQGNIWSIERGTEGCPRWEPPPPAPRELNSRALTTAMSLRVKVRDLAAWCKDTLLYTSYLSLVAYKSVTGETVPQMLAREIREGDKDVFPRVWSQSATVELGLCEMVKRIWIV